MIYKNIFLKKKELNNILNIYRKSINNVGVNNLYYPFIFDSGNKLQKTIGIWNISLYLKKFKRGAHMSRIFFFLEKYKNIPLNIKLFLKIYKILMYKLESNDINIQVTFIYFIKKISPISKNISLMNYKLSFFFKRINIQNIFFLKIIIPVINLCPCSKNISYYNAHNQRSKVYVYLNIYKNININKTINYIENESSSEIWSLLKRNDEKYITEFSYNNPKFVEDIIRNILLKIKNNNLKSFLIKVENYESIHNHNVYSLIKY
ncbi:GTP cyclohydrolase I type 2 [Candidatus Nasuia deltocephalinicola]|nr:GTP cyclohydrolase I type 2 [Candidatus Nasuia deltocephalinicola]